MNAFEIIGLPEKLSFSDEEIRDAFRKMAADLHPDSGGDEQAFAALQAAQETLLSPGRRLKAWVAVRGLDVDTRGQIEGMLMDLFQKVSERGSEAEALIKQNARAQSTLAKAMIEIKLITQREKVKDLLVEIEDGIRSRTDGFAKAEEGELDIGKMMRDLVFLEKWRATLKGIYGRLM